MKKLLFIFICISSFLSSFCEENIFTVDGFNYEIISETDHAAALVKWTETEYSGDVTIPSFVILNGENYTVTKIAEYAFEDCSELTSMNTGSVKIIERYAFMNCVNLQSVVITASVKSIADNAFTLPMGITNLTFEDTPNPINVGFRRDSSNRMPLFYLCDNPENNDAGELYIGRNIIYDTKYDKGCFDGYIKNLTISENVTEIRTRMFSSISFVDEDYHLILPNSIITIGEGVFANVNLSKVTLSQNLATIGVNAFYNCRLKTISIPNSVTLIGDYAFSYNKDLYDIYLGSQIQKIGAYGFYGCSSIFKIYSYSLVPPTIYDNVFSDSTYVTAELHIPKDTSNAYSAATGWKNFIDVSDDIDFTTGINDIYIDNIINPIYFDLMGNKIESPQNGIFIEINGSKVTKKYFK